MKKLLLLGAVCLIAAITTFSGLALPARQDRADNKRIQDRFIGAWGLAWLEEPAADGKIHRPDCTGLLVYTRDGHMSVQVMYRKAQDREQRRAGAVRTGWLRSLFWHI